MLTAHDFTLYFFKLDGAVGDYAMQERKQWRRDRFREWYEEEFSPEFPQLAAGIPWEKAWDHCVRERLVGKSCFCGERSGGQKPSRW